VIKIRGTIEHLIIKAAIVKAFHISSSNSANKPNRFKCIGWALKDQQIKQVSKSTSKNQTGKYQTF